MILDDTGREREREREMFNSLRLILDDCNLSMKGNFRRGSMRLMGSTSMYTFLSVASNMERARHEEVQLLLKIDSPSKSNHLFLSHAPR